MAQFRCEAVQDVKNGKYFVELYYPQNSSEPIAVTPSIFNSFEEAEQNTVSLFKKWVEEVHKD